MNDITRTRLQLLANGWTPLAQRGKRCLIKGWPALDVTPDLIRSWERQRRWPTTGVRVQDGLAVIDLDVDHEIIGRIAQRILDELPELADERVPLLIRKGAGHKEAWFVRTDVMFGRFHSHAWVPPGGSADAGAHRVEVFAGGSAREFGAEGPHTIADDGTVAVTYRWVDRSPVDTRLDELPVVGKQQFSTLVGFIDDEFEKAGWTKVPRSTAGENHAERVYDLTDDMHFDTDTDERLSLLELRDRAAAVGDIRCSASWLEGPSAVNRTRCLVSLTGTGHVSIWETASGVTHVEAAAQPPGEKAAGEVASAFQKLQQAYQGRPSMFDPPSLDVRATDGLDEVVAKLLETYAYCPSSKTPVMRIWTKQVDDGMTFANFKAMLRPYAKEMIGPRGGMTTVNPADLWLSDKARYTVEGSQVRPGRPRPVFEEHGLRWINAYTPPVFATDGGSADIGIEFMEQLVPDPVERAWFLQALAYKVMNPAVPGPGVVMVAHDRFGTGRGTFALLLSKLLGEDYVQTIPFHLITGKTYQSQYNEWADGALAVVVNESSETEAGTSAYQTKQNTYEALKEAIDPTVRLRTIVGRGRKVYKVENCAMVFIATNHIDAVPVPEGDRRVCVLRNGDPREPAYWDRLHAWMAIPANVAAFYRWLGTIDVSSYSPFASPPVFEDKLRMSDANRSDIDVGFDLAMAGLGEVFTSEMVVTAMHDLKRTHGLDYIDRWELITKKLVVRRCYRVGVRHGQNWLPMFNGRRLPVYTKTPALAKKWTTRHDLRDAVVAGPSNVIPFKPVD